MLNSSATKRFEHLTAAHAELILRLRLVIARAAQPDSLDWWNDRSLTAEGAFLADRLFARRPRLAAAKLALAAARARHTAAMSIPDVSHLYDLGEAIEYELEGVVLDERWIPAEPVANAQTLLDAIADLVLDGTGYACEYAGRREALTGALEIRLSADTDPALDPVVANASALALAYGEAGLHRPVFPYLKR